MTTREGLVGGNFSANAIGFIPPTIAGLKIWSLFGTAVGDNVNVATGGPTFSNIGAGPSYSAGYGHFVAATTAINSGLADTTALQPITVIAAMRIASGTGCMCGTFTASGGNKGFQVQLSAAPQLHGYSQGGGGVVNLTPTSPVTSFALYAMTYGASGVAPKAYDLTAGTSATGSAGTTYVPNTGVNLSIGSDPSGTAAACDLAFFAAYTAFLSGAQLTSLVPAIRSTLANRGITV